MPSRYETATLPSIMNGCCQGLVTTDYYGVEISGGFTSHVGVNFFVNTVGPLDFSHTSDANGGSPAVSAGEWHHVAGTYDGTQLRLYIDGQPWGNPTLRSGVIRPMSAASFLSIGSEDGRRAFPVCCVGTRYFNGLIDEASRTASTRPTTGWSRSPFSRRPPLTPQASIRVPSALEWRESRPLPRTSLSRMSMGMALRT